MDDFSLLLLNELRQLLIKKIIGEWDEKWNEYGPLVNGNFHELSKYKKFDPFLTSLLDDVKFALTNSGKSHKLVISKAHLRRVLLGQTTNTNFQKSTKECLSVYIGYGSWDNFIMEITPLILSKSYPIVPFFKVQDDDDSFFGLVNTQRFIQIRQNTTEKKDGDDEKYVPYTVITDEIKKINYKRLTLVATLLLVISCSCFFLYGWYKNRPFTDEQRSKVKFFFLSEYDKPNTSTLKIAYDVSSLGVDSVTVDYGYDEFHLSGTAKIIKNENFTESFSKNVDTISHTYFKPNVWSIKLIANGQVIKKLSKIVYSGNEWTSWASGRENRTLWIGKNVSSNVTMKNSILHYDKKDMEKQGGLDYFYTKHQINQDFQIAGDSATLELRVKNPENDGGFTNYDTSISFIDGTQSYALINLIQDSIEYGNIVIAKTSISGKKKFLPFLDIDLQKWRVVKIKLKDKIATFYIDNVKIFQTKYDGNISLIKGIRVTFKGSGSVDWLKLSNSHTNEVVYYDNFSR